MTYKVVADTEAFILVDKQAGVSVHKDEQLGQPGLFNQLKQDFAQPLYPAHRLDVMTSGLLLLAKTSEVAAELGRLFEARAVEKYYLAIASGKPRKKQGLIVGDMTKSRGGSYKLLRSTNNPAKTRFVSQQHALGLRAYLLKPYSGKTHQLRVMMKSIGVAILGDERYGGAIGGDQAADRGYLHAYALRFTLNGVEYRYRCPPSSGQWFEPPYTDSLIEHWQEPWALPWGK
ncbi:putative RNA pseudouridine synthase [Sinobacterium norvegicum]|uniref:RNA pseudouridine synthase n=1 Tax=Sinobacterium norvegicum TaxID=1641715 RepID=A0ABM9AB48_9GAMM|nr:pseudouridine synthase [Sinobacterium norvegicum]CAH0990179.1 putative RNA pseudouridine synthase [Sinobacterium norvegicum]